jgi:hypothetical protein
VEAFQALWRFIFVVPGGKHGERRSNLSHLSEQGVVSLFIEFFFLLVSNLGFDEVVFDGFKLGMNCSLRFQRNDVGQDCVR